MITLAMLSGIGKISARVVESPTCNIMILVDFNAAVGTTFEVL